MAAIAPGVLIVGERPEFRALLAHHIGAEWPHARVLLRDHASLAAVAELLDGCDVVLLEDGAGTAGRDFLRRLVAEPGCPPVVFLTATTDESAAVAAIRTGAHDYLPKSQLSNARLVNAVRAACRSISPLERAAARAGRARVAAVSATPIGLRGYRLLGQIANRGPAEIYLADYEGLQVALKVLRNADDIDADVLERFLHECEVVTGLRHPDVVRIYDHGVADDMLYIAMEYFPRGDLKSRLARGMSPRVALRCVRRIARALDAIHDVGILHCDLKPANVMVRGDRSLALIDFGHARQMFLAARHAAAGAIVGTPYYMSPEQGRGDALDARSDIYSLGALTFELLTGRKPYTAASPMAVLHKHAHAALPALPGDLHRLTPLLARMLAKNPLDRFQTAAELLRELDDWEHVIETSGV